MRNEQIRELAATGRIPKEWGRGGYGGRNNSVGDIITYEDGSRAVVVSSHEATHMCARTGEHYSCGWVVPIPASA